MADDEVRTLEFDTDPMPCPVKDGELLTLTNCGAVGTYVVRGVRRNGGGWAMSIEPAVAPS